MTDTNLKLQELITTIKALRGDRGCPWDKRQTSESLIKHLRAECQELIDGIENLDWQNTCEELGDVLYIIIMISEIHKDRGDFDLTEVISTVNAKLIRRHPHVFAGHSYESEEQLQKQWQEIKALEKKKNTV